MKTWSNFLTRDTETTDKDLHRLIERREMDEGAQNGQEP